MPESHSAPTPSPDSRPTASHYVLELPLAGDLQKLLPEGQYLIERFLGQGGMGAVYKGLQMPLRRPVAVKIMQKGASDEFAFEERFRREAYAMAALMHPHIVHVYDCGDAGPNYLFISMELVEGGDLSQLLKAGGMTPEYALQLLVQICDALQAAHDRGIVHRDIKPANIFITGDGQAKVADFGLAKTMDAKSFMTQTGMGMGTPDYAAPEQFEGAKDLDHRADIYALGVMMYQMLTGVLPRGAYRPPSQRAAVDSRLDDIVFKAMEHAREDRYQSAAELMADILSLAEPVSDPADTAVTMVASMPLPDIAAASVQNTTAPLARSGPMKPMPALPRRAASAPTKEKGGMGMVIGVLGVVAMIAGGAFIMMQKKTGVPPASQDVATTAASSAAESPSTTGSTSPSSIASTALASSASPSSSAPISSPTPDSSSSQTSSPAAATSIAPATAAPSHSVSSAVTAPAPRTVPPVAPKAAISAIAARLLSPDYEWSEPVNLGPGVNGIGNEIEPSLSADGLILVFARFTEPLNKDLFEVHRSSVSEPFGEPRALAELNTSANETSPSISSDGLTLFFGGTGQAVDIMESHRTNRNSPWAPPVKLESPMSMPLDDNPSLSPDGLTMVLSTYRTGPDTRFDLYLSQRASPTAPWGSPKRLGPEVNTPNSEYGSCVAADNRTLLFARWDPAKNADIGIFVATPDVNNRYQERCYTLPFNIGVNNPWLSPDGRTLWVSGSRPTGGLGAADLWQMQLVPTSEEAIAADLKEALIAAHPKIAQLETGFQARYATDAQKPFEDALASLRQSYVANGIPRARAAAEAKGSLPEVNALDEEKAALEKGDDVPVDTPDTLPGLKSLHATYRDAVAKLEAKREKGASPLYDLYIQGLNHYVFELTRDKKIDEARQVTLLRDHIAKRKSRAKT